MIISIDLDGKVYDRLEEWGSRRGLTVEEALRVVLGNDFPDLPEPPQPDKSSLSMESLLRAVISVLSATRSMECPTCLAKLKVADIISGECSACGAKF